MLHIYPICRIFLFVQEIYWCNNEKGTANLLSGRLWIHQPGIEPKTKVQQGRNFIKPLDDPATS